MDATQTTGRLTFVADGNTSFVSSTADGMTAVARLLYEKTVETTTDPKCGASPCWSTSLPVGTYRVYAVPDDPQSAVTITDTHLVSITGQGDTFYVNPRTHVRGRVVLGNGVPVYGADVVISPSADSPLNTPPDDVLARVRESHGTTDANGYFDVLSDPTAPARAGFSAGAADLSVRPPDGTHLPWIVLTNLIIPPSSSNDGGIGTTLKLPTLTMPLPSTYPPTAPGAAGTLTDSHGIVLPHAIIRAYAFPTLVTPPDGGTPTTRAARLIGMTTSDSSGNFQLFTVPPDP
jgi:hypothetical protein